MALSKEAKDRKRRLKRLFEEMHDHPVGNLIVKMAASAFEEQPYGGYRVEGDIDPNEYLERACKMLKKIPHTEWDDRLPQPPKCKLERRLVEDSYGTWYWEDALPRSFSRKRREYD